MSDDALIQRIRTLGERVGALERLELPGLASGSWTPAFAGTTTAGSFTYAIQTGQWSRYGPLVLAWFELKLSAIGVAPTGNVVISGLPAFPIAQGAGVTIAYQANMAANTTLYLIAHVDRRILLYTGGVQYAPASLTATAHLVGSVMYTTTS